MTSRWLPIALMFLACAPVHASPAGVKPGHRASSGARDLPALLLEVEKAYSKAGTLSAEFSQTERIASMDRTKSSSGRILIKKPNRLRWETEKPDRNLLVSDGKTFWFYTPPFEEGERGQVIVRDARQVQSKLADALLSGNFAKLRGMRIEGKPGGSVFVLKPGKGSAGDVKRAEVTIEPEQKQIRKVVLEFAGGNRTEIALSNIRLGESAPDEKFQFKTPENTDVLKD
jgi:outer membrane lipoprotein carrier protein